MNKTPNMQNALSNYMEPTAAKTTTITTKINF